MTVRTHDDVELALGALGLGEDEARLYRLLVARFRAQEGRARQSTLRGMAVMRRAEEMLARAKHEIVLVATFLPHDLAVPLAASLRDVRARGVRVRTVVTQTLMD